MIEKKTTVITVAAAINDVNLKSSRVRDIRRFLLASSSHRDQRTPPTTPTLVKRETIHRLSVVPLSHCYIPDPGRRFASYFESSTIS